MKKLLICIPTYNRLRSLKIQLENLNSLKKVNNQFDVFVFDNDSTDGTQEYVKYNYNDVFGLIENKQNVGFNGNFLAIINFAKTQCPSYRYLWVLSDDDIINYQNLNKIIAEINCDNNIILLKWTRQDFEGRITCRPDDFLMTKNISNKNIFEIINSTALVSSWIYPIAKLEDYNIDDMCKIKENTFLQVKFTVDLLIKCSKIQFIDVVVGFEFVNLEWRFDLEKTFAKDRYEMLEYMDNVLKTNCAKNTTKGVCNFLMLRAISWTLVGKTDKKREDEIIRAFKWFFNNKLYNAKSLVLFGIFILLRRNRLFNLVFNKILYKRKLREMAAIQSEKILKAYILG